MAEYWIVAEVLYKDGVQGVFRTGYHIDELTAKNLMFIEDDIKNKNKNDFDEVIITNAIKMSDYKGWETPVEVEDEE